MCCRALHVCVGHIKALLAAVHLEPVIFLSFMAIRMTRLPAQELYLQKACQVDLDYNETVCSNLANHTEVQKETQKLVSGLQGANGALQSVPSILVALVVGPLSDRHSRKPLLLVALGGYFLLLLVFLVNVWWFQELGAAWLLLEWIQDLTGGELVLMTGLHALLVDTTPPEDRTRRLTILDFFMYAGSSVGVKLGVVIKEQLGWIALFLLNVLVLVVNVIYIQCMVREKDKPNFVKEEGGLCGVIKKILLSFLRLLKSHRSGRQPFILLLLLILILFQFAGSGPSHLFFLFRKLQYGITLNQYANLSVFITFRAFITNLFLLPFMTKYLNDTSLILLSILTSTLANIIMTFGDNLFMLYLTATAWFLYMSTPTITRSLLSKLVEETEVATVFALHGILAKITDFVSYPCFSLIYAITVDFFPGTFGLVCAGANVIIFFVMIPVHRGLALLNKRKSVEMENQKGVEELETTRGDS